MRKKLFCAPKVTTLPALTVRGSSKIKLKKANKKRRVTVRRVIIFLNISRHPLLIWLHCCLHQYKTVAILLLFTFFNFILDAPHEKCRRESDSELGKHLEIEDYQNKCRIWSLCRCCLPRRWFSLSSWSSWRVLTVPGTTTCTSLISFYTDLRICEWFAANYLFCALLTHHAVCI